MARKTRKDKLRDAKKRRQTARRLIKVGLGAAVIAAVLAAAGYGAWQVPEVQSFIKSVMSGGRSGGYEFSPKYERVGLGEPFDFAGGELTIDTIRTSQSVKSMFGGGVGNEPVEAFKPKRGIWLLVLVTFEGGPYAEGGTMDPESVKLTDEDGNIYPNQGSGSPAEDLYYETSTTAFGTLKLTDPQPRKSLLIFDVSPTVKGLLLAFLRDEDGVQKIMRGAKLSVTSRGR